MRRTGPFLRQQKDTCSCWLCRDEKYREKRQALKHEALKVEFIDNQRDIEPEILEVVNKNFWDLL